ncbi:probable G-protein coupled receptor 156 [Patella vulgata]|uniref:probable G-protein coupled receptor 156 n=1 Tax=Patella vulgata TaxID=6465 RepID=UPI00217FC4C6|nr:probable G-protein coupled receptor 156 [Patella vulgata]XP_050415630.1 probable G-protein coupled receptor 156 [Patella vulgata]XP_050415631.1 probable G-protein coupled receptor 156 [Patella vulgata]
MDTREIGVGVVVVSWVCGSILSVMSLVYLILNIRLRNTRLIKMSSPNLNILVASGGLLSSITCVLFGIDFFIADDRKQVSNICQLRVAFLSCSFSLLYGPLLAKCWRVYRIFEQASLKRVVIRDNQLFIFIGILLLGDVILMSAWQMVDPLQYTNIAHVSQIVSEMKLNLSHLSVVTVTTCSCNNIVSWLMVTIALKTPVLIAGLFLAWKTRDVMLPSMNDCYGIIISTLTTISVSTTIISISSIFQDRPNIVYGSLLLGIFVCSAVTTSMVFVPKLMLWWKNPEKADLRVSMSAKSTHNVTGIQTFDQFEDDMYSVVAENRSMKKSLQEKDLAINDLQKHLSNAQKKLMEISLDQEARQDSGLDIDLSSSSGQDDSDANTSGVSGEQLTPEKTPPPPSLPVVTLLDTDVQRQHSLKSYNSSASVVGYNKLCRLRDSIAEDLNQAKHLSTNIRTSISRDMDKVDKVSRHRSFRYDSLKSRQELAGSIAQSYNLADSGETYSYVSSCVTSSSNLQQVRNVQYSSSESIDTLPNDKLYPERRKKPRRHMRRGDLNKTVYTISANPRIVQSAVTLSKSLDTDTFV